MHVYNNILDDNVFIYKHMNFFIYPTFQSQNILLWHRICVEGAVLYLCCWCCHKLIESIRVCTQCAYYNKNTRSYHRDTVPGGWTNQQLYVTQKSVPGSLRGNNDIFFNNKQFLDCQIHKQFFLLSDIRDLSYINFIFGYDLQRFCYLYMKFIY